MDRLPLKCKPSEQIFDYIVLTDKNFEEVRNFVVGKYVYKADNPTISKGRYFGVFMDCHAGRVIVYVGDVILKIGENEYIPLKFSTFSRLFNKIDSERE